MKYFLTITILGLILCTNFIPQTVSAQKATDYNLLAPIPLSGAGSGETQTTTAGPYIKGLFQLIIAIAGALAVVKIIFGGIQYMSTDAFTGKNEAKTTIENAIWGLILAISAWLILYTINPKLVEFNLSIPVQQIATSTAPVGEGGIPPVVSPEGCVDCEVVLVRHKSAPNGCAAPGPCIINRDLNNKLVTLNAKLSSLPAPLRSMPLEVTEAFPTTRVHKDPCHNSGTCVDATFLDRGLLINALNIKTFIDSASASGLRAVFETSSPARAAEIRRVTGLSTSQVIVESTITAEHFSVYM